MSHALDLVVRLFGSTAGVAKAAGVTPVAVRAWRRRGVIPARRISALLAAAKARRIKLDADDFFARGRK